MDNRRTMEPTTKQAGIMAFIIGFNSTQGKSPTEEEIASAFEIHRSAVQGHIGRLVKKGLLRREGRVRSLRINL